MKTSRVLLALTAAVSLLAACEADESAPSRPRTNNILTPDNRAQDNAFQRENEAPKRDLPTAGREFPGQTRATPVAEPTSGVQAASGVPASPTEPSVVTASLFGGHRDPAKPVPLEGTDSRIPETRYPPVGWYPGPIPNLPENPGSAPMAGSTPVPGTALSIDYSWGQVTTLENFPHRAWPEAQTPYMAAVVKQNTPYLFNIQNRLPVPQNDSSFAGNWINNAYEVPWFCLQTLALPAMMVIECPVKQVTTQRLGHDPNYLGYLPADGPIAPAPVPGVISWEYPFLLQTPNEATTAPAERPIAPTPGLAPVTPGTSLGAPDPAGPREAPAAFPGLK